MDKSDIIIMLENGVRKFRTDDVSCIIVNTFDGERVQYTCYGTQFGPTMSEVYNDTADWFADMLLYWGNPRIHPTVGA